MEPDSWAALAAWVGFLATAGAGYFTFRQARIASAALRETRQTRQIASDQAQSARESATSANKSADAALSQAKEMSRQTTILEAQLHRIDEPVFEVDVNLVRDNQLAVRGRMVQGQRRVEVTVEWINRSVSPDGQGGEVGSVERGCVEKAAKIFRNGEVSIEFEIPAQATNGLLEIAFFCTEVYGGRYWPITETVRWAGI